MKKLYLILLAAVMALPTMAQKSNYDYNFYGFVRSDFFYNSRDNAASFNEIFYLYPLDVELDAAGNDLNSSSSSGFFSFITRLGVDLSGPNIGTAKTSAKIEVDFGGYSSMNILLRIRHAYINLDWEGGSNLIIGQTWHPLFGDVMPTMVNVSTGSPYQPFSRSPQLRYQYKTGGWKFLAAALSQNQYTTSGVNETSIEYFLNCGIPEFYTGFDYTSNGWLVGGGVDISTIAPRTTSSYGGETYKVKERLTSVSGDFHLRYTADKLKISAKSVLASALDHTVMLGGYGVTSVSGVNGEQSYTPIRNSSSWLNIVYGDVWRPSIFIGYVKNLGSSEELYSSTTNYGRGLDIDQLLGAYATFSYNQPSWSVAIEYSANTAWYGELNLTNGRVYNTHDVTNHRVTAAVTYLF
ncbi:MAG: hypothetical protein R3Y16_02500 [Rikenellaceae bacterium]